MVCTIYDLVVLFVIAVQKNDVLEKTWLRHVWLQKTCVIITCYKHIKQKCGCVLEAVSYTHLDVYKRQQEPDENDDGGMEKF